MSSTATLNRTDGTTSHSKNSRSVPRTGDSRPSRISDWDSVPIQYRRKLPKTRPLELQNAKTTKPPLTLKTSPSDIPRPPQDVIPTPKRQPHSAYTYTAFPSVSPNHVRDVEKRNSTWAVPRRAYVPTSIPREDNVRCNILYVSNLPMETSEDELDGLFASQAGYRRMSLRTTASGPSCPVEFDNVTTAARALRNLYGWPLKNSRMGGIRLSFSRDHVGIPAPRALTPRSPKPPPPPPSPPILPVRTPPPSPSGFPSAAPAHRIAGPKSPTPIPGTEFESVSSPRVEYRTANLMEDKPDERHAPIEAETEIRSQAQTRDDRADDGLDMHIIRGPDYKTSTFDQCRLWIERAVEMDLDWYPLPPIKQPVKFPQFRLAWTYNGHPMSIYVNEDETQCCSSYLEERRGRPPNSKPTLPHESPAITHARKAKTIVEAWVRIQALSWRLSRSPSSSRPNNTSHGSDTTQRLGSHLCLEKHPSSTQDATLLKVGPLEDMEDDFEFFIQARRLLCEAEGSWMRQLLPWSYHQVKFSRLHHPSDGSDNVQTTEATSVPDPRHIWGWYECKRPQGAEIDIHMRVCAHIMLQGIRYPEIGLGSRTLLDSVPKLKRPFAFEKELMTYGWGFFVRQSPSIPKMLAWTGVMAAFGLTFIPFFASLSLFMAVFALFVLRLGAHT